MGVHGLWNILEPSGKPVTLQSLQGKVLAVDVSIWLHQGVKGYRDKDGNPLKNAHLLGVFFRVCKLLNYGIKPIFVFDGGVPALKRQTLAARKSKKLEAQDQSEITRRKLLSNLIRTELQKQTKQAIPPSVLIQAGIKELASSSKRLRSPKKKTRLADEEDSGLIDGNDLESLQSKLENNDSINSALFVGGMKEKVENDSSSSDDDDYRNGRNYVEHFSSITSADFDSLPLEIQHEILFDMQESKKNNSWASVHEMPKELHNFSSFQMDRLVKRRFLQKKIQSVQKEMGNRHIHVQNLDELLDFENEIDASSGQTEIIGSKDRGAVLIKVKPGPSRGESSGNSTNVAGLKSVANVKTKQQPEVITIDDWPSENEEESHKKRESNVASKQKEDASLHGFPEGDDDDDDDAQLAMAIELSLQQSKGETADSRERVELPSSCGSSMSGSLASIDEDNEVEIDEQLSADIDKIIEQSCTRSNLHELESKEYQTDCHPADDVQVTKPQASPPTKKSFSRHDFSSVLREAGSISNTCSKFFDQIGLFEVKGNSPDSTAHPVSDGEACPINAEENIKTSNSVSSSSTDEDDFEEVPPEPKAPSMNTATSRENSQVNANDVKICVTIDQNTKYDKENDIFSDLFEDSKPVIPSSAASLSPRKPRRESNDILCENENSLNKECLDVESITLPPEKKIEANTIPKSGPIPTSGDPEPRMLSLDFMQNQEKLHTEQRKLHDVMGQQDRIATSITDQMYIETQELLSLFGIPYIVCPTEAESQCAFLDTACLTDGTVTDDSDIFLFGGKRVYKNFFSQGEKQVEFYQYSDIVKDLNLDREKLVVLAILVGSDYTNGVEGVGPVTGLEILAEFPSAGLSAFDCLLNFRDWWQTAQEQKSDPTNKIRTKLKQLHLKSGFPSKAVYDAYMEPTIDSSLERFRWGTIDKDSIIKFTQNKFGWNESKCEANLLPVMKSMESREKQLTLDRFVTLRPLVSDKPKIKSKRLANAMKKIKKSIGNLTDEVALSTSDSSDAEMPELETETSQRSIKRRRVNQGASTSRSRSNAEQVQPQSVPRKVRLPKPVSEIPQKVQEETRRQQNKMRAIEILKNKK